MTELEKLKQRKKKAESLPKEILKDEKNLYAYLNIAAQIYKVQNDEKELNSMLVDICLVLLKGIETIYKKTTYDTLDNYCYITMEELLKTNDFKLFLYKVAAVINNIENI